VKITAVRTHLVAPVGDVQLAEGERLSWLFIEIDTDEGITGVGECSNWPGNGNAIVRRAVEVVGERLIGEDPRRIEQIWQSIFGRYTYLGSRGLVTTVMSGIDIALWDIRGKALGEPIHRLLGGQVRDAIGLYTHPGGADDDAFVADAIRLAGEGYRALKLDPFQEMWARSTSFRGGSISPAGIAQAVERVGRLRDALGHETEIMVDAHGVFNVASALAAIRALEPFGLMMFEEPVPPQGLDALRQIRRRTSMPLCVGERLYTRWDFLPVLAEGLVDFIMPDVCWTGGISELRRIAALAEPYFIPVMPHNALGPIQILAGAHTMMTVPNFHLLEIHVHWLDDLYNKCITEPLDIRQGTLHLSERPGLGVELDPDFLAEHAVVL
jgi:galactonate dehydratase